MTITDLFQFYKIKNVIFELLNDKEKLILTSCNNFLYSKRTSIVFTEIYFIKKEDICWKYYDQITKAISHDFFRFPRNLKNLGIKKSIFANGKLECDDIPQTLYYLEIDQESYFKYENEIPESTIIEFASGLIGEKIPECERISQKEKMPVFSDN